MITMITKAICRLAVATVFTAGMWACQDNAWDDHYTAGAQGSKSLMQLIDERPDLSRFAQVVRDNKMDEVLSSSQTFTVFAPDNKAMEGFALQENALEQFLYNHICRYTYTLGDVLDAEDGAMRVMMLNGKYQDLECADGGLMFGRDMNVVSVEGGANGVLNTIDGVSPFYRNLYEEINAENRTASISEYLRSMDQYTFLPEKSTVIGVNDKGETLYDSVFNYRNDWMTRYGDIYKEDSVYTMLVPSDEAWEKQYKKIEPYFRTVGEGSADVSKIKVTGTFSVSDYMSDSLAEAHTKQAMLQDLVYRKKIDVEHPDGDSIVSTTGHVFHAPQYLFAEAEVRDVSNGQMYVTDDLKFLPTESWHEEIRVEAENSSNYMTQYCGSTSSRSVENFPQFARQVSENKFLYVTPPSLSFQKNTVRFGLPNTLAGTYNIYIVTLPASAVDTANVNDESKMRSTKLNFYLAYVHEDGTLKEDAAIKTPSDYKGTQTPTPIDDTNPEFITHPKEVDKMLVARNFKFPYANYTASPFASDLEDLLTTAYLRVECVVTSAADLAKYEKYMRIDCIILEPVNEPENE